MNKFVLAVAISGLAACTRVEPCKCVIPSDNGCTSAQYGQSRCTGTLWQTCNGSVWATTKDCAVSNENCVPVTGLANTVRCTGPRGGLSAEFENCTGSGQGNCASGLTCVNLNVAPLKIVASMCVTDCSASASVCTAPEVCDTDFGWCVSNTGTFGDPCGLGFLPTDGTIHTALGCPAPLTCDQVDPNVPAFFCDAPCDGGSVNTGTAGCASEGGVTTECLAGAFVEIEQAGGVNRTCTTLGSTTECAYAQRYVCSSVTTGGASPETLCARPEGRCGVAVPDLESFNNAAIEAWIGAAQIDATHLCNVPGQLCKPDPSATAGAVCTQLPKAGLQDDGSGGTVTCLTDADCQFAYGFSCQTFTDGKVCAVPLNTCVLVCGDPNGGPDLTCPTGTSCIQVKVDCAGTDTACQEVANQNSLFFPLPEVELSGTSPKTCPDGTGCSAGYACMDYSGAKYCMKARKVCAGN